MIYQNEFDKNGSQELECVRLGKKKMHENPKLIFSEITQLNL
jgi:hypothetical protein